MVDFLKTLLGKAVDEVFKDKHWPYVSVICYLFAGIIGLICCVTLIVPLSCNSEFLDSVTWKMNIDDTAFVVRFALLMIAIHLVYIVIRNLLLRTYDLSNVSDEQQKSLTHILTIGDMTDLLSAAATLLFMISAFLQMYHTQKLIITLRTVLIYLWISYKFVGFIYVRFANKNVEIINNSTKRHPN